MLPAVSEIPSQPGVYKWRDKDQRVIYVGKAKNLKSRLSSYLNNNKLHPRTQQMVDTAQFLEWTIVGNEIEALTLEYNWIRQFNPRFNVVFRTDDKSYLYLAISSDEFPRVLLTRGKKYKKYTYFGPYPKTYAIRNTFKVLQEVYKIRGCSTAVFNQAKRQGRPCLLGYINKCSAPCVGHITTTDYIASLERMKRFLKGDVKDVQKLLTYQMEEASSNMEFEVATIKRDQLQALKVVIESNTVELDKDNTLDVIGLFPDELEVAVHIFQINKGVITAEQAFIVERGLEQSDSEILVDVLMSRYLCSEGSDFSDTCSALQADLQGNEPQSDTRLRFLATDAAKLAERDERSGAPPIFFEQVKKNKRTTSDCPPQVSEKSEPSEPSEQSIPPLIVIPDVGSESAGAADAVQEVLERLRGTKVEIRHAQRGAKRDLLEKATENAKETLRRAKMERTTDLESRTMAINEVYQALELKQLPLRVECYDVSHLQGKFQTGAMVVFEDGLPKKKDYRLYNLRGDFITWDKQGVPDDTAAVYEVIRRRLAHFGAHSDSDKFAYNPQLLLIDGGKPQVNAAYRAVVDAGLSDQVEVAGIAKRLEEIWRPSEEYPRIMSRHSLGMYLIQSLRDEAHRFSIVSMRKRQKKDFFE